MNALVLRESSAGISGFTVESFLLKRRLIFFNEEVTAASANQLIEYLLYLDAEAPGELITILISSPGGDVAPGIAAFRVIQMLKSPVRTINTGCCASMGAVLFSAGSTRECLEGTQLMIHDPLISSASAARSALEMDKDAKRLMETRYELASILAERCGRSVKEILKKTGEGDCYMNAAQAVEWGLATGICTKLPL